MNLLDLTHGRETYEVALKWSPLWEAALGIAVITYPEIHASLTQPVSCWTEVRAQLDDSLLQELDYVQQNNTWHTLLLLLHRGDFTELDAFLYFIEEISDADLLDAAMPYLGAAQQDNRRRALAGDANAEAQLVEASRQHKFFPQYIPFIATIDPAELRRHLTAVMRGWYDAMIAPELEQIAGMLERDVRAKKDAMPSYHPEAFVEWATGGVRYQPEPSVTRVLLIPHSIYRPWNMQAYLEGTRVIYYPIADESLEAITDPYRPPSHLVTYHKALGDETRLRILKLLHEQDRTLQDLTEHLQIAKSTVHHHLSLLRSAHLAVTEGNRYTLGPAPLELAQKQLLAYFARDQGRDPS